MAFCKNCGTQMEENTKFCPSCGTGTEAAAASSNEQQTAEKKSFQDMMNTPDTTSEYDSKDIEENKIMAILSYLSILVLIPWFAAPQSKFARYHAKQGVVLCFIYIVYIIISSILSAIIKVEVTVLGYGTGIKATPEWLSTILWIISIPIFLLSVLGIVNALQGKAKEIPFIGKYANKYIK